MQPNPKYTLTRWYHGCKIVSVLIDHARELRGETNPKTHPFPDGHDGWEHELFTVDIPTVGMKPPDVLRDALTEWRAVQGYTSRGGFLTLHDACEAAKASHPLNAVVADAPPEEPPVVVLDAPAAPAPDPTSESKTESEVTL